MTDHTPFLATIARNPADMGPRLVYSDWLEERGDPRAEYLRLAIEADKIESTENRKQIGSKYICEKCGHISDFARRPSDYHDCDECGSEFVRKLREGDDELMRLNQRCAVLLVEHRREWTMAGLPESWSWCRGCYVSEQKPHVSTTDGHSCEILEVEFQRGFPEILTLRWEEWQRHYQTLRDSMPVREVRLTTQPDVQHHSKLSGAFFEALVTIKVGDRQYMADASSWDVATCMVLSQAYPGHDAARPIRYTLPDPVLHGDGSPLPRGIDPRTIFPYRAETSVGVIP